MVEEDPWSRSGGFYPGSHPRDPDDRWRTRSHPFRAYGNGLI
jgi:hypothetical protein